MADGLIKELVVNFLFHQKFNKLILASGLMVILCACAAQKIDLKQDRVSRQTLIDEPKKHIPKLNPEKQIATKAIKGITPTNTGNRKKTFSKDKLANQLPKDDEVEKVKLEMEISGLKERIVGMDGIKIIKLMGAPAFRRSEPPAKIWQYRTLVCIVNIFLYEVDQKITAEYIESLGKNQTTVDENECFKSILKMKTS